MANMFQPSKAATPAAYLAALEGDRAKDVKAMHAFIRKTVPSLKPFMISGMIGYGPIHYVYDSGREGDWAAVLLSARANYVSLYACATVDGKYLAESYEKKLPKASIGKSCVRFKKLADLDMDVVAALLKQTEAWAKGYVPATPKKRAVRGR